MTIFYESLLPVCRHYIFKLQENFCKVHTINWTNQIFTDCSPDPTTNSETTNFQNFFDHLEQVLQLLFNRLLLFLCQEKSDWFKIRSFGIGCWIWWARYWVTSNPETARHFLTDSNSIKSSYILIIRTCTYLNLWKGYGFIMSIILLRTVQIIRSHRGKNCKCAAKNEAKVSPESVRWYSASQRESIKSKHLQKGTLID